MYCRFRSSKTDMEVWSSVLRSHDRSCRLRSHWIWGKGFSRLVIHPLLMRMTKLTTSMHRLQLTTMYQRKIWWKKNRTVKSRTMYHLPSCRINLEKKRMRRIRKALACKNYSIDKTLCLKLTFPTLVICLCKIKRGRQQVFLFNSSLKKFHKLKWCICHPRSKLRKWSNKSV